MVANLLMTNFHRAIWHIEKKEQTRVMVGVATKKKSWQQELTDLHYWSAMRAEGYVQM